MLQGRLGRVSLGDSFLQEPHRLLHVGLDGEQLPRADGKRRLVATKQVIFFKSRFLRSALALFKITCWFTFCHTGIPGDL